VDHVPKVEVCPHIREPHCKIREHQAVGHLALRRRENRAGINLEIIRAQQDMTKSWHKPLQLFFAQW
jgi:putative ribosome biogenesis GTPase RsgA